MADDFTAKPTHDVRWYAQTTYGGSTTTRPG